MRSSTCIVCRRGYDGGALARGRVTGVQADAEPVYLLVANRSIKNEPVICCDCSGRERFAGRV